MELTRPWYKLFEPVVELWVLVSPRQTINPRADSLLGFRGLTKTHIFTTGSNNVYVSKFIIKFIFFYFSFLFFLEEKNPCKMSTKRLAF